MSVCGRHRRVIARFQGLFSVSSAPGATIGTVNAPSSTRTTKTAAITGGTAVAVAAVPAPEGGSHAESQQLELDTSNNGGGASAPSPMYQMRWLA
jgi:hypothetical protein